MKKMIVLISLLCGAFFMSAQQSNQQQRPPERWKPESTEWYYPVPPKVKPGVGVSIGRLFFDFVYEFGLNQVESDFEKVNNPVPEINYDINIDKRTNVMSISLGVLF